MNLYAYCANNPVYYVDPSGHICEKRANEIIGKLGAGEVLSNSESKKLAAFLRNKERRTGGLTDAERQMLRQVDRKRRKGDSKTFYTVQNSVDARRLLNDGLPWPTDPHRANIGDGVYAWSSQEDALNYFNIKSKRTSDLQILEFKVLQSDLDTMKLLDLTKMSDDEVNKFLDSYARLNGGTPNHGYDYIKRMTGIGVENYFNKSVFGKLQFKH